MKMASAVRTGGKGTVRRWALSMSHVRHSGSKSSGTASSCPGPYKDISLHTDRIGSRNVSQQPLCWACSISRVPTSCSKHHVDLWSCSVPCRKKKAVHKTTSTDDKRLQNTLKRLGVNTIPGIEEVNLFMADSVIHFSNPKGVAPSRPPGQQLQQRGGRCIAAAATAVQGTAGLQMEQWGSLGCLSSGLLV